MTSCEGAELWTRLFLDDVLPGLIYPTEARNVKTNVIFPCREVICVFKTVYDSFFKYILIKTGELEKKRVHGDGKRVYSFDTWGM